MIFIQDPKKILKDIYEILCESQVLKDAKVVYGYPISSLPNPLLRPLAAVNLYNGCVEKETEYTNSIKLKKYTYIVDLYVPTEKTGSGCMELLSDIANLLLAQEHGESQRICKISDVKYDSNGRAFKASLTLELSSEEEAQEYDDGEIDASKVKIIIDGSVVAFSNQATVKVKQNIYDIYGYGESQPIDSVILSEEYTISINDLQMASPDTAVESLIDFSLQLKLAQRTYVYEKCRWNQTTQDSKNKNYQLQSAVACSTKRHRLEEE